MTPYVTGSLYLIMTLHFHFVFQNCDGEGSFKKGLLWQQRDKLFSRWKERYFILTKDYFHCFKKASSRITEMGGFIFKVSVLHTFLLAFILLLCISSGELGGIQTIGLELLRNLFVFNTRKAKGGLISESFFFTLAQISHKKKVPIHSFENYPAKQTWLISLKTF
jgi:hypothetical protein